jgi:dolichyl-phosphate-mannose-protein mannosyltransferase
MLMVQTHRHMAWSAIGVVSHRACLAVGRILSTSPRVMACTLFGLSLALHLGWLAQPNEVVFDEVHYGKYVSGYLTGHYFFNNHPPLGKLMVAGVARLAGVTPAFGFRRIGAPYPHQRFLWLRLLPALCGAVLVPLVYLVALRSARSRAAATLAGMFVLLDNALLVQSKFLLLDTFLLVFGFLSLYLFWQSRLFFADGRWGAWAALGAAVATGLCLATKWTGLGFWSLLLVFGGYRVISKFWRGDAGRAVACLAYVALWIVPLVLYTAVFFLHFALLPKPGPGNRFMTPRFKASQAAGYPLRDFPANVWEVHRTMYVTHVRLRAKHPYSSRWYVWPLMMRPIAYWTKEVQTESGQRSAQQIALLGNPCVWWTSTGLTAILVLVLVPRRVLQASRGCYTRQPASTGVDGAPHIDFAEVLLVVGYLVNLLPFAWGSRTTYLYYYLPSLIFSILIASVMWGRLRRGSTGIYMALVVLTLVGFLVVSPVTFGARPSDWPWWGTQAAQHLLALLRSHF